MNISIISYGHIDSITALSKYLSKRGNIVNLFIVVYDDRFVNSIADFDLTNIPYGIVNLKELKGTSVDTDNLIDYTKDFNCWLLKLPSRSLKDPKNLKHIYRCCKFIKENKCDVVHFNGESAHQITFYLLLKNIPKVLTIHDYIPHSGENHNQHKNSFLRNFHYKAKYFYIHHSYYYRNLMLSEKALPDYRVKTIYYAPFDFYDYYNPQIKIDEYPSAIFFGRISPYKGLEYFCKAIEIVHRIIPDAKYYILGRGNFYFDINSYTEKYPIEIINKTHIENNTLTQYISRASVVIIPYTDATQSGVVVTAYSFNKPVIASKTGGIPEIVVDGETGYLVEPKNPEQLAEKMVYLFQNRNKLDYMSNMIRKLKNDTTNRFMNWSKIAEETEDYYQKTVESFHKIGTVLK